MKIEQIYTSCLSQAAYYIESEGEAAIIDPLRDVDVYTQKAEDDGAKVKYIFETHFHADFVSGHLTLSEQSAAPIIYGPEANPDFEAHIARDGEVFELGKIRIRVLHTPGHTLECCCFLLEDEHGKERAIFTGDTLFIGDVGRPDLAQEDSGYSAADLARKLYHSLREKILPLPDDITVYPAHGAGSACGKNMSSKTFDSLGSQKKHNYALDSDLSESKFIDILTNELPAAPSYFPANVSLNKNGYREAVSGKNLEGLALSKEEFAKKRKKDSVVILDVRGKREFASSHIPNSIFIGLDGKFAPWVGDMIKDIDTPLLLVTPKGREEETIRRLARVGFDNVLGYLTGGFSTWQQGGGETAEIESIEAAHFVKGIDAETEILDVRTPSEYEESHLDTAALFPVRSLEGDLKKLSQENKKYIHCRSGYRSLIAASILKKHGIHEVVDVIGGYRAIEPLL